MSGTTRRPGAAEMPRPGKEPALTGSFSWLGEEAGGCAVVRSRSSVARAPPNRLGTSMIDHRIRLLGSLLSGDGPPTWFSSRGQREKTQCCGSRASRSGDGTGDGDGAPLRHRRRVWDILGIETDDDDFLMHDTRMELQPTSTRGMNENLGVSVRRLPSKE